MRLCLLWDFVSDPRSLPARSTRESLPLSFDVDFSRKSIWQIACDLDDVSLASVACVVRLLLMVKCEEWKKKVYQL